MTRSDGRDYPFRVDARRHYAHGVVHYDGLTAQEHFMVKLGLYVRLEAKPGKESEVEAFLKSALPLAEAEPATEAWFVFKMGPATFGVFDVFEDESGRQAHLNGQIAAALMAKASELFASPPRIEKLDLLAAKL